MKSCSACRTKINLAATKCPYCQTKFNAAEMDAGRDEFRRVRRLKLVIFVGIIVWGYYWLTRPGNVEWLGASGI